MDNVLLVNATIDRYKVEAVEVATKAAASLRRLLLPILHRWGVGMCRHQDPGTGLLLGGTLIYPWGSLTLNPEAHSDCVGGTYQVYVGRERRALDAIGWLYPELSRALWTEVMVPVYSDDRTVVVDLSTRLLDYMEDIPLPVGKEYVWITQEPGSDVVGIEEAPLLTANTAGWEPIPQSTVYYGPVTREYLEDVCGKGYDYLHALPRYSYGWESNQ